MSLHAELEILLNQYKTLFVGIDTNPQWNLFVESINQQFESYEKDKKYFQRVMDLSHEEVNKMWGAIRRRDLLTQSVFDASSDSIIILDHLGQIIEHNKTALNLVSRSYNIILGLKIETVFDGGTLKEYLQSCFAPLSSEMIKENLNKSLELNIVVESEYEKNVILTLKEVITDFECIYVLYMKDISYEKDSKKIIEESRARLLTNAKMSALGEMAGGVAHEINTPLAVIQIRTDQLLDMVKENSIDFKTMLSALNAIDSTIKKISTIINGLRSFARDGKKDEMSLNSLSKIIDETFILCKERFKHHSVQLSFKKDRDYEIKCRPVEISQVLLNLLSNAFDAIEMLETKWIEVSMFEKDQKICVAITDSGAGIPLNIQKKIMEPFFTTKDVGRGTGLGLSISQGIMNAHQGSLEIDNTSPNTKFILSFTR